MRKPVFQVLKHGVKSYVRDATGRRIHFPMQPTRAHAEGAVERYLATGEKPAPCKRGPKRGTSMAGRKKAPPRITAVKEKSLCAMPAKRTAADWKRLYFERLAA
jgi:hypothetical protein